MPPAAAGGAVWRFVDALIWNWLIGGTDAHAKNYSLLMAGDQVRLAPLYDIASALPYGMHERKLRFAMKLGGDYRAPRRTIGLATNQRRWSGRSRLHGRARCAQMAKGRGPARIVPVNSIVSCVGVLPATPAVPPMGWFSRCPPTSP
jgi:hypothetical protein